MGVAACHHESDEVDEGPSLKKSSGGGSAQPQGIAWGFSSMRGWRKAMEDAHITLPSLGRHMATSSGPDSRPLQARGWDATALFGVMDGHGGVQVARFCERHLPGAIAAGRAEDAPGALAAAFLRMDELLWDPRSRPELRELSLLGGPGPRDRGGRGGSLGALAHAFAAGCAALACCVRAESLVVANAGDCRAVLCRSGRALGLSEDHKPELPPEAARVRRAGGWVEHERHGRSAVVHRVNGDLSLSRAIGDLEYKQNRLLPPGEQLIVATPDVRTFRRQRDDEFLLLACDGVWDVVGNQEAVDFVRARLGLREEWAERLAQGSLSLSSITEELLDRCVSPDLESTDGLGGDNMTAILLVFLPGVPEAAPAVPAPVPAWGAVPAPLRTAAVPLRPPPRHLQAAPPPAVHRPCATAGAPVYLRA